MVAARSLGHLLVGVELLLMNLADRGCQLSDCLLDSSVDGRGQIGFPSIDGLHPFSLLAGLAGMGHLSLIL